MASAVSDAGFLVKAWSREPLGPRAAPAPLSAQLLSHISLSESFVSTQCRHSAPAQGFPTPGEGSLCPISPHDYSGLLPPFLPSGSRCPSTKRHSFLVLLSANLEMWANGGSRVNGFPSHETLFRQATLPQGRNRELEDFCFSIRPWIEDEIVTSRPFEALKLKSWRQLPFSAPGQGSDGVEESSDSSPTSHLPALVLGLHVEFGQALDES